MTQDELIKRILSFARMQYGKPYVWGGKGPESYDCSGLVTASIRASGAIIPADKDAQQLYEYFTAIPSTLRYEAPVSGCLLFFGEDFAHIEHVAIALNDRLMAEAAHGDHTTSTLSEAERRGARVFCSAINHRKDLLVILLPDYVRLASP